MSPIVTIYDDIKLVISYAFSCSYLFTGASVKKRFEQPSVVGRLLGAVMSHLQGPTIQFLNWSNLFDHQIFHLSAILI